MYFMWKAKSASIWCVFLISILNNNDNSIQLNGLITHIKYWVQSYKSNIFRMNRWLFYTSSALQWWLYNEIASLLPTHSHNKSPTNHFVTPQVHLKTYSSSNLCMYSSIIVDVFISMLYIMFICLLLLCMALNVPDIVASVTQALTAASRLMQ